MGVSGLLDSKLSLDISSMPNYELGQRSGSTSNVVSFTRNGEYIHI